MIGISLLMTMARCPYAPRPDVFAAKSLINDYLEVRGARNGNAQYGLCKVAKILLEERIVKAAFVYPYQADLVGLGVNLFVCFPLLV